MKRLIVPIVIVGLLAVMIASTPDVSFAAPEGAVETVRAEGDKTNVSESDEPLKTAKSPIIRSDADANKDGKITPSEWTRHRKAKERAARRAEKAEREREEAERERGAASEHEVNNPDGTWTPYGVALLAHNAGFRGEEHVMFTALVFGESGGRADARGDTTITTGKWGPSIGLGQVRSLWADDHTGRTRDRFALVDPRFNIEASYQIARDSESHGHHPLRPWSVYTSGKWRDWEAEAREAVRLVELAKS